jgi:hypothetical protein
MVLDTAQATPAPDAAGASPLRSRRVWLVAAVVVVGVLAVSLVTRPRAATPDEFTAFSQRLGTLPAPGGSFIPYDPVFSSYLGSEPQGSWVPIAQGTWADTEDPFWWAAVRGWEATVPRGHEAGVCGEALAWLTRTGSELGLTPPGHNESLTACLSSVDHVRSNPGIVSDSWSWQGTQTADGELRYRTGAETFTGTRYGDVVIRLKAEASVANR